MTTEASKNTQWWKDTNTSAWDRVKEALRRDWEQTRSDFSGGKKGKDLNQDAGDTVAHALGNKPIPPGDTPNPPDAQGVEMGARDHDDAGFLLGQQAEVGARRSAPVDDVMLWEDAQLPLRFGYGAGSHYGGMWNDTSEAQLRKDWEESYPGESWDEARELAQRGWNHARMRS